jgi:RND family efflux transporter MFP subunit
MCSKIMSERATGHHPCRRFCHAGFVAFSVGMLAAAAASQIGAGAAPASTSDTLECLIEPRVVAKLASPVQGVVAEVLVDRGDLIRRGDPVARLDSAVEAAAVEVARIQAANEFGIESKRHRSELLKRKRDRAQTLQRVNVVAESALDEAATEARIAELEAHEAELSLSLARAELKRSEENLKRRTINSPIDGIVTERSLSAGEFAYEQAPIMTVAEIDPLHVEVYAPLDYYHRVKPGMRAEVRPEEPIGGSYTGIVTTVDRVFDAGSGTFGIRLDLPNPDHALPAGLHCKLRFLPERVEELGLPFVAR